MATADPDTTTLLRGELLELHRIAPSDVDALLELWQSDEDVLHRCWREVGARTLGAEVDGELLGFVFVLDPGVAYASRNYAWFSERYEAFAYLDRVAIDERARRRGVGSAIYDAIEADARDRGVPLLLEVNVEPPNEPSLAFHCGRGYAEVGRQPFGTHEVAMFEKPLRARG